VAVMPKAIMIKIPSVPKAASVMEVTMEITWPGTEVHNRPGLWVNDRMAGMRELSGR
jgi:hypothetical protein